MLKIEREVEVFLHAFLMGIIVFACYLCFEALRRLFPHRKWLIHIEDAGYWIGISIYLFVQFYHTNNGKIRWFSVLGIVIGAFFLWKILLILGKTVKKLYIFVEQKIRKNS